MSTFIYDIDCNLTETEKRYFDEDTLLLDIETTGFKADYQHIYLIGCAVMDGEKVKEYQFFAETYEDEANMLKQFLDFAAPYKKVITFNGEAFDLPFINKRLSIYGMDALSFDTSIDIFKESKSIKSLLALSHYNQKSIEEFLGIIREDQYDGGKLIPIYKSYMVKRDEPSLKLLLLHNFEDVKGMLPLLNILSFKDILSEHIEIDEISNDNGHSLIIKAHTSINVPKRLISDNTYSYIIFDKDKIFITIPLFTGQLKYYYPNPKDYVYLKDEGIIIPKILSSSLEKSSYEKANKENCYISSEGIFMVYDPAFTDQAGLNILELSLDEHLFKLDYTSKLSYIKIDPDHLNKNSLGQYVSHILNNL